MKSPAPRPIPRRRHHARRGFTLAEVLVTIGVLSILLLIISLLFVQTTRAVSQGVALSDIMMAGRGVADKLAADIQGQQAPDAPVDTLPNGGFLAIVNQRIPGVELPDPTSTATAATVNRRVRSAQLAFIHDPATAGGVALQPVTPAGPAGFGPTETNSTNRALVWYGHGITAASDGSATGDTLADRPEAWRWVLARQARVLYRDAAGGILNVPAAATFYADGPLWNDDVIGLAGTATPSATDTGFGAGAKLYHGLVDRVRLAETGLTSNSTTVAGYLDANNSLDYRERALDLAYLEPDSRLQLNTEASEAGGGVNPLWSWKVGQMHALLASGVGDFIVQFAGDVDGDGAIDVSSNGAIVWYDLDSDWSTSPAYRLDTPTLASNGTTLPTDDSEAFVWRHDEPDTWPELLRIRYRLHDPRGAITGDGRRFDDLTSASLALVTGPPDYYTLTQTGAFADYTYAAGDEIGLLVGGERLAMQIRAKVNDDQIELWDNGEGFTGTTTGVAARAIPVSGRWFEIILRVNRTP